MTRGKYVARAATRREAGVVTDDVASYRRAVVDLVRQREQLEAQLAEERRRHVEETSVLRAQRGTGMSPETEVRDARIRDLTSAVSARKGIIRTLREKHDVLIHNACRYLSTKEGCSPDEALHVVMAWAVDCNELHQGDWNARKIIDDLGVSSHGWVASMANTISESLRGLDSIGGRLGDFGTSLTSGQIGHRSGVTPQPLDNDISWQPPTRDEWIKVTKKLKEVTKESIARKKRLRETLRQLAEAEETARGIQGEIVNCVNAMAHERRLREALAMVELRRAELDKLAGMMGTSPQPAQHRGGGSYRPVPVSHGKRI